VVDPGAVFSGSVYAQVTAANTLELAAGTIAGGLSGIGTSFTNFNSVLIDSAADWTLSGSNSIASTGGLSNAGTATITSTLTDSGSVSGTGVIDIAAGAYVALNGSVASGQTVKFLASTGTLAIADPTNFGGTVSGLVAGDIIDFTTLATSGSITAGVNGSNQLILNDGSQIASIQLDPLDDFTGEYFHAAASGNGVLVTNDTSPCFCAGTRIRTVNGEVAVEELAEGDLVVTASGKQRPIRWIGRRSYKGYFVRGNRDVLPIRIKAGALADNVPSRDLCVSPLHAMLLDGYLIPAFKLVNGVTVVQ
jgi:hypothetical protein